MNESMLKTAWEASQAALLVARIGSWVRGDLVKIMVRTTIFAILLLGMAPAAFAATSQQGGAAQTFTFPTRYYDTARPGDIDGRLNITVYPSGIVNGFYLSTDTGRPVDVVGG